LLGLESYETKGAVIENDMFFPDEIRDEGRKQLQNNNVDHELRVYPGVPHGMCYPGGIKVGLLI